MKMFRNASVLTIPCSFPTVHNTVTKRTRPTPAPLFSLRVFFFSVLISNRRDFPLVLRVFSRYNPYENGFNPETSAVPDFLSGPVFAETTQRVLPDQPVLAPLFSSSFQS